MHRDLEMKLQGVPPLSRDGDRSNMVPCKICGHPAPFFDLVDFNKVTSETNYYAFGSSGVAIRYNRCGGCGFLFTTFFDEWQPDDFRRFIYNDDYSKVDSDYAEERPKRSAERFGGLLRGLERVRILDYGSGSGAFTRCMSDHGFSDVQEYDPFSHPERPTGRFNVIICNEVLEHSPDPIGTLRDMQSLLTPDGCILLGETLQPEDIVRVRANWWYCAPRNGHCSTFAERTLAIMAVKLGLLFHRGASLIFRPQGANVGLDIARRVRSAGPFFCSVLNVPRDDSVQQLHPTEATQSQPFRWTTGRQLTWRINVISDEASIVQVRIPFVMEVQPGFAARCQVFLNDKEALVTVNEGSIVAEATGIAPGTVAVALVLPDHKSPAELGRPPDGRKLGLALVVGDVETDR
jgi:SAM-dependent methyltransferase